MKKTWKIIGLVVIMIGFVASVVIFVGVIIDNSATPRIYDIYTPSQLIVQKRTGKPFGVVVIGKECPSCRVFMYEVESLSREFKFNFYVIDMSSEEAEDMLGMVTNAPVSSLQIPAMYTCKEGIFRKQDLNPETWRQWISSMTGVCLLRVKLGMAAGMFVASLFLSLVYYNTYSLPQKSKD